MYRDETQQELNRRIFHPILHIRKIVLVFEWNICLDEGAEKNLLQSRKKNCMFHGNTSGSC